jgi:hypothetical protein
MKEPLPVFLQNLIDTVSDTTQHPEQRQHYANRLKNIIDQCQLAYDKWNVQYTNRK